MSKFQGIEGSSNTAALEFSAAYDQSVLAPVSSVSTSQLLPPLPPPPPQLQEWFQSYLLRLYREELQLEELALWEKEGSHFQEAVQDMAQAPLESQLQQSVLAGPTRIREGVFACKDAELVRHAGSTQMGSFGSRERQESSFTVNSDQQVELEKSAAGGNMLETVDLDSYRRDIGPIFDFLFPKVVSPRSPVIANRATDIVQPSDLRGKFFGEDVEREETIETRDNLISKTVGTASNFSVLAEFDSLIWGIAEAGDAPESFTDNLGHDFVTKSSPAACFGTNMSEITCRKCKDVILSIETRLENEGCEWVPLLSDPWRRSKNSFYKINLNAINQLDFEEINERLDKNDYKDIMDFISDMESMLDGVAEQFFFSSKIKAELVKVREMFIENMKRSFPESYIGGARTGSAS